MTQSPLHLDDAAFVHRVARALVRDPTAAADLAQDALAAAVATPRAPVDLRAWFTGVLRHLAARQQRAARLRAAKERARARDAATELERTTHEQLQLHSRITAAVAALPEPYRTAIKLHYFDGLTPGAIAKRRSVPAATVRQHLHRGRSLLRARLDREYGARDAWSLVCLGLPWAGPTFAGPLAILGMKKLIGGAAALLIAGTWMLLATTPPAPRDTEQDLTPAPAATVAAAQNTATTPPESPSTPALARDGGTFHVRILTATQQPLAGATVHCWTDGSDAAECATDPDGLAAFAARHEPGGIAVFVAGRWPHVEALPACAGEHRVVLHAEQVLAGSLAIDGAPAAPGIRLALRGSGTALPAHVPERTRTRLASQVAQAETATTAHGAFRFEGLPRTWRGTLWLPRHLWALPSSQGEPGDNQLARLQPDPDLRAAATALPALRGRVVWDDDGSPVPYPAVDAHAKFADGEDSPILGTEPDAEGRFVAGFFPGRTDRRQAWLDPRNRSALAAVSLRASSPLAARAESIDVAGDALAAECVVRLQRARMLHFRAVDRAGKPVAGARVAADDITSPTGADGRGQCVAREQLLIGAPGYQVNRARAKAPAAGTEADPVVFELAPANELRVRVRTPAAAMASCARVVLTGRGDLFAGPRRQAALDVVLGSSRANCSLAWSNDRPEDKTGKASIQLDDRREIVLHSLEPEIALRIAALSALGEELATRDIVAPAPGRTLIVDLEVRATPRAIRGRVVDDTGAPVAGANVQIAHAEGSAYASTDAEGVFTFAPVFAVDAMEVMVDAPPFAPQVQTTTAGDRPIEFHVARGRSVTVRVVDAQGEPVAATAVATAPQPVNRARQTLAPGTFAFRRLPPGAVVFSATIGSKRFEIVHDTSIPEALLRVERPGRVRARKPANLPPRALGAGYFTTSVTRLDTVEPSFDLALGERWTNLLPGRYRVALVEVEFAAAGGRRREAGPQAEVSVRAGETVDVELQ